MSKTSTSATSAFVDSDEAPPATQADIDRAVFRIGGQAIERGKVRVEVLLDTGIVRYFKSKAGKRRYETLISKALGEYVRAHS